MAKDLSNPAVQTIGKHGDFQAKSLSHQHWQSFGKSQSGILLNSLNERLRVAKNQPEFFKLNSGRTIRNGVFWRRGQVFHLTG
jgi:hypothetical protein